MVKEYVILVLYDTDKMFTSSENVWSWSLEYIYLKKELKWQQMSVWQIVYKKKKKEIPLKFISIYLPNSFHVIPVFYNTMLKTQIGKVNWFFVIK